MPPPFRIGVMQLTMEPLEEILEHARAMDEGGFDTIWLAEAYPWWRKHSMEARSSTALSAVIARETEKLAVGWGIISPFTRHPIQIAMEARVTQEAAGQGRFYLGLGVSKIFMRHAGIDTPAVAAMKEAAEIVRGLLAGEALDVDGKVFSAHVPALRDDADAPRWPVPLYVAGTGPMMLKAAAQVADGLLTASMERGGRLAAKAAVTDEILDKCEPIAGSPEDCVAAIEEYRDAGCTHVMLELWGNDRV